MQDSIAKAKSILAKHNNARIAYSGGADSDVVLDFMFRYVEPVKAVMWNTGVEFDATLEHIAMKQKSYDIEKVRPENPVVIAVRKYGYPFISKRISDMIDRLQRHEFNFAEQGHLSFDELYRLYPNCKSALRWWCDNWGEGSRFSINRKKQLKDFLIEHDGLPFRASQKCCRESKKKPSKRYAKNHNIDLFILGMRKSEGGVRATAYKNCYQETGTGHNKFAQYFPLFFWDNNMKNWYVDKHELVFSKCYTEYGLTRTGCAACPYGSNFQLELEILKAHEPMKYKAIKSIFELPHKYQRLYSDYKKHDPRQRVLPLK